MLKDIDLEVKLRMTVALVGQSGSGKSTLVDLIPRFWDTDSGTVEVGGHNVRDYRVSDLRSLMGNVNQEAILLMTRSIIISPSALPMPLGKRWRRRPK